MTLKVSQLLDGQLEPAEVGPAAKEIAGDSAARDRLTLYGLIGDSLRGNSTPDDGYTQRILQAMRQQAVQTEPGYDPLPDQ